VGTAWVSELEVSLVKLRPEVRVRRVLRLRAGHHKGGLGRGLVHAHAASKGHIARLSSHGRIRHVQRLLLSSLAGWVEGRITELVLNRWR
jgi:hypothetical protein